MNLITNWLIFVGGRHRIKTHIMFLHSISLVDRRTTVAG